MRRACCGLLACLGRGADGPRGAQPRALCPWASCPPPSCSSSARTRYASPPGAAPWTTCWAVRAFPRRPRLLFHRVCACASPPDGALAAHRRRRGWQHHRNLRRVPHRQDAAVPHAGGHLPGARSRSVAPLWRTHSAPLPPSAPLRWESRTAAGRARRCTLTRRAPSGRTGWPASPRGALGAWQPGWVVP